MTKREQRRIVNELCAGQKRYLLERLDRVPAHWDGHELRAWFRLAAEYGYRLTMDKKRERDFRSDVYQSNL
jgi:hypothetical protein